MHEVSTVLVLLTVVTALAIASRRLTVPYPTLMVIAGLCIALVPGLPDIQLSPDVVFLVFLPPLLYSAAWYTTWHEFKANRKAIVMLALGLVLVTTLIVGLVAHTLIPGLPLAAAFALGAIVSPPDAIAATAIAQNLRIPRRITAILEGESLVNDATGLVAYRVSVAALLTGAFSWNEAALLFVLAAAGGVLVGLIVGWVIAAVHRQLDDPVIETTITLLTPFIAYLPAETLHLSGVLAVVTTGLYVRRQSATLFSSATRLHAVAVWDNVVFLLNGLTFVLLGLELRDVMKAIADEPLWLNISWALAILVTTVVVRLAWVFPAAMLNSLLNRCLHRDDPLPSAKHLFVIGWTGMRGVVSLAAALALPATLLDGTPFPKRDLILFIVFVVILGTLVGQSLTLPWLIRRLGLSGEGRSSREQEADARLSALSASTHYLEQIAGGRDAQARDDIAWLIGHFEQQANAVLARMEWEHPELQSSRPVSTELFIGALESQRHRLDQMHQQGLLGDELLQQLEREIDLEETRIRSMVRGSRDLHGTVTIRRRQIPKPPGW
jgi:monovalent cation/hydrogen antiporter